MSIMTMPLTVSAHDVAAVLRRMMPGVQRRKLHKLLYFAQGHHVAAFDAPLFEESIAAWDEGPVVAELWQPESDDGSTRAVADLSEAQLNTLGYVASRYGGLTDTDLDGLTRSEDPWRLANQSRRMGESVLISLASMRDYFRGVGAPQAGGARPALDSIAVSRLLSGARDRLGDQLGADDPELIRERMNRGR